MTSFVAWVGVDQRGPASVYLASDSRISWGTTRKWDFGKKLFASRFQPDVMGYVGDVLFPSVVIGQIIDSIDAGVLYPPGLSAQQKFDVITKHIMGTFKQFPTSQQRDFSAVYVTRDGKGMSSSFYLGVLEWSSKSKKWDITSIPMPPISSAIWISGTGKFEVATWKQRWDSSSQGNTSRAVFSAFCDSLRHGQDPYSGGAPQLVGLYRIGGAKLFGVVSGGITSLSGLAVESQGRDGHVEWRNEAFERCSSTGQLVTGGQKHYVPKGLGGR